MLHRESAIRHHEIDALRSLALGFLIIYHIFICYQPFGHLQMFIQYGQLLDGYWFIGELFNIWRIPVLFLIAGLTVGFVSGRRTVKELLTDRLMRLVPPVVFFSFCFSPLFSVFYHLHHDEPIWYLPEPYHLWFVLNLVVYTFLLLPLILYFKIRPENAFIRGLRRILPWGLPAVLVLPLMLETVLTQPDAFAFFPLRFWYGLICFASGFILVSTGEKFWASIRTVCHVALPVAIFLYLERIGAIEWVVLKPNDWMTALESGLWMIAFLGYGSLLLNRPYRIFGYLNEAVFPIYIIHLVVLQLVAFIIFSWQLNAEATFALHILFTFAICLLLYEGVIRRNLWLYPIMGLKLLSPIRNAAVQPTSPARGQALGRFGKNLTFYILTPLVVLAGFGLAILGVGVERHSPNPVSIPPKPVAFRGHYYQVFPHGKLIYWKQAADSCAAKGGYLVIIDDAEENDFLTTIGAGNGIYYLGASDHDKEGDWRWGNGRPMDFQNWKPGEPNNSRGNQDYLVAYHPSWPKWHDTSWAFGFICEWDTPPKPDGEVQK